MSKSDSGKSDRAVVVGAGPVGLYTAIVLARAGHRVTLVDRDPGPDPDGTWTRKGVMQFRHPHFFRAMGRQVLAETAPDLIDAMVEAGARPVLPDGMPELLTSLACRRSVFERALRQAAANEPGLTLVCGHADHVIEAGGRVSGLVVDGAVLDADLVVNAMGRSGHLGDDLRAPAEGGGTGFGYIARMYRARPGAPQPDLRIPRGNMHQGYLSIVFPQDAGTYSTLLVRPEADRALGELRHESAFDAAARAIPNFAEVSEPELFEPITEVMAGANLTNTYRGQLDENGQVALPGMFWVGDAVLTTNPAAGRGISLGLKQAQTLVSMIGEEGDDHATAAQRFDAWCTENLRPWFHDHIYWDETLLRRFAGEDIDVEAKIPSDVICAAGEVDPSIMACAGPYLGMLAGPAVLAPVEQKARDVLRTGWRPKYAPGPARDELVELVSPALAR